jgi:hypothetical protein
MPRGFIYDPSNRARELVYLASGGTMVRTRHFINGQSDIEAADKLVRARHWGNVPAHHFFIRDFRWDTQYGEPDTNTLGDFSTFNDYPLYDANDSGDFRLNTYNSLSSFGT